MNNVKLLRLLAASFRVASGNPDGYEDTCGQARRGGGVGGSGMGALYENV